VKRLVLTFEDRAVTATVSARSVTEEYDDRPEDIWTAALAASAAALGDADVKEVGVRSTGGALVVWDQETMGSPTSLLDAVALGRLADTEPHTWALVEAGRYAVGPLDSYVIARMTRGIWNVMSASAADRLGALPAPPEALPEVLPDGEPVGRTEPSVFLGLDLPIRFSP
jgi:glycerol kinase